MKSRITAKTLTILAVTALAVAVAPLTALAKPCSVTSLKGTFADKDSGYITGVGPFAGVNLDRFDGNGKITMSGMFNVNGELFPGAQTGTYTVNPDCSGTYTVEDSGGNVYNAYFVIDDNGNELQILVTNRGTVITCVARKQFPVDDDSVQ